MFTTPEAGVWDGTTFMMGPVNTPTASNDVSPCVFTPRKTPMEDTHFHTHVLLSALQIHPRSKHIVGRRMALAAASTAYGRTDLIANGPTLKNCSVVGNSVQIFCKMVTLPRFLTLSISLTRRAFALQSTRSGCRTTLCTPHVQLASGV